MNAPAIVLADEPTGNLDSRNSREIMSLLQASNREMGQTLIVITHDEEIALAADRIIAVEDGCIGSRREDPPMNAMTSFTRCARSPKPRTHPSSPSQAWRWLPPCSPRWRLRSPV